jgi:hypothetical protein
MNRILTLLIFVFVSFQDLVLAKEPLRILFIGNSYTYRNHMPRMFMKIAKANGKHLEVNWCVKGKTSFYRHSLREKVYRAIQWKKWDYVVLQGSSRDMLKDSVTYYKKTLPGLNKIVASIKQRNPKTKLVFFMTWAYKKGYPKYAFSNTHYKMIRQISAKYKTLASDYDALLTPVGLVFEKLYFKHQIVDLYKPDNSHPSKLGSYAAACSFYSVMFKERVKHTPQAYLKIKKHNEIESLVWKYTKGK